MKTFVITKEAREIFGDVVDYAYIKKPSWASDEEFTHVCDKLAKEKGSFEASDAHPVFVKFLNGKSFILWASEWGGIEVESEEDYLEESW